MSRLIIVFSLFILSTKVLSLDNGLGLTPQMGWNSWNAFHCGINETIMTSIADALVSTGLADLGYKYLNLDDCWCEARINGTLVADNVTFPQGIPYLTEYAHNKGLKFGIYSDAGLKTCQGRPGSLFHEETDADTFAEWGVDYLKYDNCDSGFILPQVRYERMRAALNQSERQIFYSICNWGQFDPWEWGNKTGNSWRIAMDIEDRWTAIIRISDVFARIANYSGIGGWNDPDMLEVGNGGMTTTEYISHFSLWAFFKGPLIIGTDIRNMSNDTKMILMNTEVIAINQDPLGKPVWRVSYDLENGAQVWAGPLSDGTALLLFNSGEKPLNITAKFADFGVLEKVAVRDLWAHEDLGNFSGEFTAQVVPHGVSALKLTQFGSKEIDM